MLDRMLLGKRVFGFSYPLHLALDLWVAQW
jgi:hypothetical protein